jgi:transcriptional regulator with XRE-family HTH domain/Zn-dependent peptidase ImmA (M78 family)
MEDLTARCVRIDAEYAPSISYLSMIERGKRVPSAEMLEVLAQVFQKAPKWFLDDQPVHNDITPEKGNRGGISGIALEPSFLFSNDILQIAIPEMLSQTGVTGKQFAQLLIRAHQESLQNHFPDLERAAEELGLKRLNLSIEELKAMAKNIGISIKWFDKSPELTTDALGISANQLVTSYFEPPKCIHINRIMKHYPTRLKYDLAVYIGHSILHNEDGFRTTLSIGHASSWEDTASNSSDYVLKSQDILNAWRDFESSFFAGALLCPKVPFRQLLDRQSYDLSVHQKAGVSPSVAMRRMTSVSPYPHWHYFDAYGQGKLKAVYRGNGIPLPWGNMRTVSDPCQHWAVFRQLAHPQPHSSAQISLLEVDGKPRIYCCESLNVVDPAGNNRVLCAGIDLNPAIEAQGWDSHSIANQLKQSCVINGGSSAIPASIQKDLLTIGKILNINWIERGMSNQARLICSRGNVCPRQPACDQER